MPKLNGVRVAILVTDNFEQIELTSPREALEAAGAETAIIAPHDGTVRGMNHDESGDEFDVDITLEEADPDQFDAVLLPGGVMNADHLRVNEDAQKFVERTDSAGRPIAVICHGPWLLVSADLVNGRQLTSYHTLRDDIENAGGEWDDAEVIRDGNWVSSRQPDDLPAFNRELTSLFEELIPAVAA